MRDAGNAKIEMLQKVVVGFRFTVFPHVGMSLQPMELQDRGKTLFQRRDVFRKRLKQVLILFGAGVRLAVVIEHEFDHFSFGQ